MSEFKKYRRKGFTEMRPYELGESLDGCRYGLDDAWIEVNHCV